MPKNLSSEDISSLYIANGFRLILHISVYVIKRGPSNPCMWKIDDGIFMQEI